MATYKKKSRQLDATESAEIIKTLKSMVEDSAYCTDSSYSANGELYPDNQIPFVDKHMNYLLTHPSIDPRHYIANLRLKTKIN